MAEHEVPDLHDVEEKIHAAHDAEDKLMHTMPNAIHPDDSAFPGHGAAVGTRGSGRGERRGTARA